MGFIWNPDGANYIDDGTYITVSYNGLEMFRVKKSNGNMQVAGGYDTDVSL